MKDQYYFGRSLTPQIDYFAFPRTGSHFFRHCTAGLYDLVAFPGPALEKPEAIDRQRELEPEVLYALDLREDGAPFAPVAFNTRATGQHGLPARGSNPVVILIRDPIATVYSYFKVAQHRWDRAGEMTDPVRWVRLRLDSYHKFYVQAWQVLEAHPAETQLVRFERLVASPEQLEELVKFIGVRPKLRPSFVHWLTRFSRMTVSGDRSFYAHGTNDAWREDSEWLGVLKEVAVPDCSQFGYPGSVQGVHA